jgi:hypothetical protein
MKMMFNLSHGTIFSWCDVCVGTIMGGFATLQEFPSPKKTT